MNQNRKNRHKTKVKAATVIKAAVVLIVLAATVYSVVGSTYALNAFGYSIGTDGVKKMPYSSDTVIEQKGYVTAEDFNRAVEIANSNPETTDFMKTFGDEYFCIKTEKRIAFVGVATDGTLSIVQDQPAKCHELKTTEMFLAKTWAKYDNGEAITYKEVSNHVKMPFVMKAKLAIAGLR